jgi:hypothetical protein
MMKEGAGGKNLVLFVKEAKVSEEANRPTGRTVDSKWPQSSTRPVILPTASSERR